MSACAANISALSKLGAECTLKIPVDLESFGNNRRLVNKNGIASERKSSVHHGHLASHLPLKAISYSSNSFVFFPQTSTYNICLITCTPQWLHSCIDHEVGSEVANPFLAFDFIGRQSLPLKIQRRSYPLFIIDPLRIKFTP